MNSKPTPTHLKFVIDIFIALNSRASQKQIYQFLYSNIDKIDIGLACAVPIYIEEILSKTINFKHLRSIGYDAGNFGNLFKRLPFGNQLNNLEVAIAGYNSSLRIFERIGLSQQWATTQNNLGIAYRERIAGNKKENLETSIAAYKAALKVITEDKFPQDWARTQYNLGNVYREREAGNRKGNIELAINAYKAALEVRKKENFPQQWVKTKFNLAVTYTERIAESRRENIELGIVAMNAVLKIYTEEKFPLKWAKAQNFLGTVYIERLAEDKKDNIELAIASLTKALSIRTEEKFPLEWAIGKANLGNAYRERIVGNKKENIEASIVTLEAALRICTKERFPQQWAGIQNNIGIAYRQRIAGNKKENIEIAITAFENALKVRSEKKLSHDWAATQNNLGNAYKQRIVGNKKENIETAIIAFKAALEIYTEEEFPQDWAATQNNIGNAYRQRIAGNKKENIEIAITAFKAALKIYIKTNLIECWYTASNLGNMHLKESNWKLAVDAYIIAIEAVEDSRQCATDDKRKQQIISNAIKAYKNIVQAYINLGQADKAIEYVERSKARNLVDLLATKDLYPKGDIPEEIIVRLRTLRQEVIAEEKRLNQQRHLGNSFNSFDSRENRSFTDSASRDRALDNTRLNRIRQELDNFVAEHIEEKDSSFQLTQKVEPISFEQIQLTLPTQQTALIEWFIGSGTLSAFIVTSQRSMPFHFSYTEKQLSILVNTVVQYFDTYLKRDRSWQNVLPDLLIQLAENLQIEAIVEQIKLLIPDCDLLILVPHRWLHLLPIHALPLADGKCLLDLFSQGVSYAPSVQLLQLTQRQNKQQLTNFFAVQNPTGDLDFTNVEVQAVRSQFQPHDDVLAERQATKSALTKERLRQANLTHFSCHGKFNFENPELSALLLANSRVETSIEKKDNKEGETRYLPSRDGGSIDLEQCLTLGEIFNYDLSNCRLVTLSACETGLTDFKSLSDEYIGLPSGFLYAGSPSVVSSLWTVSDISTSFLMIKFYQNLQEIDSVPVALNQAQLWLRSVTKEELQEWVDTLELPYDEMEEELFAMDEFLIKTDDNSRPFASPYHWGAFCAVGS